MSYNKSSERIECPKCGYRRGPQDKRAHPLLCPSCGIAYNKFNSSASREAQATDLQPAPTRLSTLGWSAIFLSIPSQVDITTLVLRSLLSIGLFLWALWFVFHGVDWQIIGGSFMHNINLPFHEFGHVLFMPLGRFMSILGGSLFQLLLPLGLLFAFSLYQRDNFGASVMLWWTGQSFVDLSPYIADAPIRALPLVGGGGEAAHDWGNLLTMMDWMGAAGFIARLSFLVGSALMLLAIVWAFLLLRRQLRLLVNETSTLPPME